MRFIIGFIIVLGSVLVGYSVHGDFRVLWQPYEFLIIGGAAIGSFIIANPNYIIGNTLRSLANVMKTAPYQQADYVQLLQFLYTIFKIAKTKGMLELESHIESPQQSQIFNKYPRISSNHEVVTFFCDYFRLITMGFDNPYQLEDLMNEDIELHHEEASEPSHAIYRMADGLPALGIIAAVLGVILTMGSITEPPEVLGKLIGAALVGTFLGVLLAYGFVGPVGVALGTYAKNETAYLHVVKTAILAHMRGNAPTISVEFARKSIPSHFRPSFRAMDNAINSSR